MLAATAFTFVVSLAIVLAVYWLFIVMPEQRAARALRRRMRPGTAAAPSRAKTQLARRVPKLNALEGLDALLKKSGGLMAPVYNTVELSGMHITVGLVLMLSIFTATGALLIARSATSSVFVDVAVMLLGAAVPYLYVRHVATRRLRQFEDQFPQAMDLIASSLRAGHAFTTGVSMVGDEVPDPTGTEFRLLYDQQSYGMSLPEALKAFSRRVPLLDARFFVTAVLTQREAGGNLAEVLDNLSTLIRERSRVKRQVRVASAHGRITGWVLSLMPPTLAVVMMVIAPEHMRTFANDPLGVRMIIAAAILQVVGTLAIRRIVDVEF
jgi:tight adherence protein B